MEANAVPAYSPTTVYGQLTSPFVPQKIHINSHTPYDKVEENSNKAVSRESFYVNPKVKFKYEDLVNKETLEEKVNSNPILKDEDDAKQNEIMNFTKPEISDFAISSLSSKDIVNSSLKKGYTTNEAAVIAKADKAYKNSALLTDNPTKTLSTCAYKVW